MLKNFFSLDAPFATMANSPDLDFHFQTSSSLENTLYQPSSIAAGQRTSFKGKKFKNVSFSKTLFRRMTFTDCEFEDCLFIGARFSEVQFHRCKFINCNLYKCSMSQCYLDPNCFSFRASLKKTHANVVTELFHTLLVNAKAESQHRHAEDSEIMFRRWLLCQRSYERRTKKISVVRFAKEWIINKAGDCIFGFGYRPFKFAIASVLFLLFCSVVTHFSWSALGMQTVSGPIENESFLNAVYYTVVVTTTLGFGDIVPTTVTGQLFASSLSIVGLIWFSLLAALVIRKVVR